MTPATGSRLILLFALLGLSSPARAGGLEWPVLDSPKHWLVDGHSIHASIDGTYTTTESNYDSEGNIVTPPTHGGTNVFGTRLHGGFELSSRFSLFAQATIRKVSDSIAVDPTVTLIPVTGTPATSRFGLADVQGAARWLIFSNRIPGGRFATASEIAPGNFRSVIETGFVLAPYGAGPPAIGNRSLDWQTLWRAAWWVSSPLAFSAGLGYTWRAGVYSDEIPFSLRADYYFAGKGRIRLWTELRGWTPTESGGLARTSFGSGSLLYGSTKSRLALAEAGFAAMLNEHFEVALAAGTSVTGTLAARQNFYSLGVAYRPAPDSTTGFYNPKRDLEIGGLARPYEFDGYHWATPIIEVSRKANFFKIGRGTREGVTMDDEFHIFLPERLTVDGTKREEFIARASVVALRADAAFLRVDRSYQNARVTTGHEARRVKRSDPIAPRKIQP